MACKCAPSLLLLKSEFDALYPNRHKGAGSSDGCCGDAAHAARKSDHNADASGYAHALDIDEDLDGNQSQSKDLLPYVPHFLSDSRCKYVIYEGRIYYPNLPEGKPYTGINAHALHLHLSIHADAHNNTKSWRLDIVYNQLHPPTTPPVEDDDMPGPNTEAVALADFIDRLYDRYQPGANDPKGWHHWFQYGSTHSPADTEQQFAGAVAAAAGF